MGPTLSLFISISLAAEGLVDLLYLLLGHAPAKEIVFEIRVFFTGGRHMPFFLLGSAQYRCALSMYHHGGALTPRG